MNEEGIKKMSMCLTKKQMDKIESLLSQMTIDEKIGQLNLESLSIVGAFDVPFEQLIEMKHDGRLSAEEFKKIMSTAETYYHEDKIREGLVGALMVSDPKKANELQKIAMEESRLGIPLLFGADVIHGHKSVYPIAIAEAGSFETDLMERTAHMAAQESRASGINWNFAPMIDVARDARWGRVSEGPGEDPYLASLFAAAKIRGLQNDQSSVENYVAACMKHYVAYGAVESGRDYNTVSMASHILFNNYLEPFRAAAEEGAVSVMAAFNDLNGVPCTVNSYILRNIMKENYGFEGFIVSDANAMKECITHGFAENQKEVAKQALNAGLDMDMGTESYLLYLKEVITEDCDNGRTVKLLNDAVRRVLSVKMWLGLFEHPYVSEEQINRYESLPGENCTLALEAALKSIVLLKNENSILPLKCNQKISLVGALADSRTEINGAWSLTWDGKYGVSVRDGMKKIFDNLEYFPCCGPETEINFEEVKKAKEYGDVIVAVLGELAAMSGEASSRSAITLPGKQRELLEELLKSGKPVILILMNGRPLALEWESEHVPCIMEAWHLGIRMGDAVAKILGGENYPEGRLSSSFPRVTGQCPVYYNHPNTGRPGSGSKFSSRYLDTKPGALYPFGYGLTYTSFEYGELQIQETSKLVKVFVWLKNTGKLRGSEVVQVYMHDRKASLVRPVKELKGFSKVNLEAGEKQKICICIEKQNMGFWNNAGQYCLEDGYFDIYVGGNSDTSLHAEVRLTFSEIEKKKEYPI